VTKYRIVPNVYGTYTLETLEKETFFFTSKETWRYVGSGELTYMTELKKHLQQEPLYFETKENT
jgi:Uri superfamily endonuclease